MRLLQGLEQVTEAKSPPVPRTMTKAQFVEWAEQHVRVMCTGLVACNPIVPQDVMGQVIAEAMGRALGSMTAYPDRNQAMDVRRKMIQLFKGSIRDAYPSPQVQQSEIAQAPGKH